MERIQSINAQRIRWCSDDLGIALDELAAKAGISHDTFQKVMDGEDGITFNQLRRLAVALNRGALFFLEPGTVVDEQIHTPQFRTIANQKPELSAHLKALIERVERQREIYLSLREDLGETQPPPFAPPELAEHTIDRIGAIVREWLGLRKKNSFDSYRDAVQDQGILVFRSNGYKGQWQIPKKEPVCGFTLYHPVSPVIVIKKSHESRQNFTLMHELGHVLLHQSSFIDEVDDLYSYQGKERESNAFAGQLLVPDEFLQQIADGERPADVAEYDGWLSVYRKDWGVSGEVILRRLLDSGRLEQDQYEQYRDWSSHRTVPESDRGSRQYRYREPKHMFGEPFVKTVLSALQDKKITLAKASTFLDNLKITDVHRLESSYAGL